MRTAVYSGSFNPLHIGHKAIVEYLIGNMDFDMVYLIVSPKNPLKDTVEAGSGRARYMAALEAVRRYGDLRVKVDDIELDMPPPQYTIDTLDALQAREPGNTFVFVMGADNLADIHRWKDYRRILTDYGVVVYPREGVRLEEVRDALMRESGDYRISIADAPMVNISSTELRKAMAEGTDVSDCLM